jgi:ribosomal protein L37AE/L43A
MSFDTIPEDRHESYPCDKCDNGNIIVKKNGDCSCDTCDFEWIRAVMVPQRPSKPYPPKPINGLT